MAGEERFRILCWDFLFSVFEIFGDAPVHNHDFPVASNHDIRGFRIALDDGLFVGVGDGFADFDEDSEEFFEVFPGGRSLL